ncbi:hypothetical protein C8J57DRAFT_1219904 [Mycena rebaudengoi]|nr:hypothetical protein C8J57DRAFT_1219904 [Mycena rebaudengoi]
MFNSPAKKTVHIKLTFWYCPGRQGVQIRDLKSLDADTAADVERMSNLHRTIEDNNSVDAEINIPLHDDPVKNPRSPNNGWRGASGAGGTTQSTRQRSPIAVTAQNLKF